MEKNLSKEQIREIIQLAKELQNPRTKAPSSPFADRMAPLLKNDESKFFLIHLMDIAFRSSNYDKISDFVMKLFNSTDAHEDLFNKTESLMVRLFRIAGHKLPSVSIPLMLSQIQEVTAPVVFFVGDSKYSDHYQKRKKHGVKLNVNLIGEALTGEEEAHERIQSYIALLNQKEVDYISVKITTIYSQISSLAHDQVVEALIEKLSILYQEVLYIQAKTDVIKFVNLDMEEYRDLSITIQTFMRTLSLPKFRKLRAGIVLQAYLPDSYKELLHLKKWAIQRVKDGGAPIKVRIVKGANMEMEKTESSMEDWPLVTYHTKEETDANFKKLMLELMDEKSASAVNIGIASHNIFDLAFALYFVKKNKLEAYCDFEMLEGMAKATSIEINNRGVNLLLYTPIVKKENYNNAIAYLVRRLDEGTEDGNFLKEGFNLKIDSDKWDLLEEQFTNSVNLIPKISTSPNRTQDRKTQCPVPQVSFKNVPNTDWTLEANRIWINGVRSLWEQPIKVIGPRVPVAAILTPKDRMLIQQTNWKGVLPWDYELASKEDYQEVIDASCVWHGFSPKKRAEILRVSALEMEKNRGNLIGVAVTELGKLIQEVDVEVSEAIDFANYYAQNILDLEKENIRYKSSGINLVLSPWNFPIAIPIGGVLASLAAGKRVILKPSQNAAASAYLICGCLWRAGVPKSALSFLPANESSLDPFLSKGNVFDAVILTGGTDTAQFLLKRNPKLNLYAETGGKNATIVTALSDRDQAIMNVVQSAFGNTGQKCSATSLLILEKEIFYDPHFKALLKDAVESKIYGLPWEYDTEIGPLSVAITSKLKHILENTKKERWLVKPRIKGDFLMRPGVKWGVEKTDYAYKNELFGPILSVMCADDLDDAIDIVNSSDFGLTSGIESLDKDEVNYWKNKIQAGNLYTNRSTTGAIVSRQPFGGHKASSFGFGMKAGGCNYVKQFLNLGTSNDANLNYSENFKIHFQNEVDISNIRGQHNISRYLKAKVVKILIDKKTTDSALNMVTIACDVISAKYQIYSTEYVTNKGVKIIKNWNEVLKEIDYSTKIRSLVTNISEDFLREAHIKNIHIYNRAPNPNGRFELLNYLDEQSLSLNYHRYGNLMGIKYEK
jgi:RHH-type proline utilization regulon transcriptional repressor/proline dehydrogenase/delta 1-pyrroline-5-carboxylate dehydrogenase